MQKLLVLLNQIKRFLIWLGLSALTGAVCGCVGSAFHIAVDWVTEARAAHAWLLYLLPLAGVAIAALYHIAKLEGVGTNNVIRVIHSGKPLPMLLAPVIFIATVVTHLFGGSAGREGAALQIGGGLGSTLASGFRLDERDRRVLTLCGMSAVFSALFGTPVTAAVFVLEVASVGVLQYSALVPCLISALAAQGVALLCGLAGSGYAAVSHELNLLMMGRAALLGVLCAGLSIVECVSFHKMEHWAAKIRNGYLHAFLGGCLLIGLTLLVGTRDYNGAGGPVIASALGGSVSSPAAFLWKLLFTAVTISFGFKGGEIVPTFFIGAAFGCAVGPLLGLPPELAAALGLAGVFCGVVNCPIASIFLSIELFGSGAVSYFALVCAIAYMLSGRFSLYTGSQNILFDKTRWEIEKRG